MSPRTPLCDVRSSNRSLCAATGVIARYCMSLNIAGALAMNAVYHGERYCTSPSLDDSLGCSWDIEVSVNQSGA